MYVCNNNAAKCMFIVQRLWILWIAKIITFTAKNKLRYLKISGPFLDNDWAIPVHKRLQAEEGVF